MGLFKSSAERKIRKFESLYSSEFDNLIGVVKSQKAPIDEDILRRVHNTAFARARGELFGLQSHVRTPDLDDFEEHLWEQAQSKYRH